jgi:hypothetical protein
MSVEVRLSGAHNTDASVIESSSSIAALTRYRLLRSCA